MVKKRVDDRVKRFVEEPWCSLLTLDKQAVHLNDTWAKDVNERLLMPAGYFCVLRTWEDVHYSTRNHGAADINAVLQLLIVKGDEEAMKRASAAARPAPTASTMERGNGRGSR